MAYRIDLENEVALVTGGSRNIGLAIAHAPVEAGLAGFIDGFAGDTEAFLRGTGVIQ